MILYFSHSRNFDFKTEYYNPIKASDLAKGYELIFPHDTEEFINAKELFDKGNIKAVIAEVSFPATGQGIELGWANDRSIPIIAVYKEDEKVSSSVKMISDTTLPYQGGKSMVEVIQQALVKL